MSLHLDKDHKCGSMDGGVNTLNTSNDICLQRLQQDVWQNEDLEVALAWVCLFQKAGHYKRTQP